MSMVSKRAAISPSYLAMARGTRELHQLIAAGKEDSPEADAIRDATDGPWEALSEVERNRVRNLAEDLYSLSEPPPPARSMNPQAQAKLNEAFEATQRGEWDRALDLLRHWRPYIDPALVSYLRARIWLEAGDPGTAAVFFGHAFQRQPDNENYLAMFLYALNLADPAAATKRAEDILQEYENYSPVVAAHAAQIKFLSAQTTSETQLHQVFELLEPILKDTIARFDAQDPREVDRSSYVMALALLGGGYEFLGKWQAAVDFYSRGLQLEPHHDALLVARGVLLYGTSPRALGDLQAAVDRGSALIWPYVLLAHHRLQEGRFNDCIRLCERALGMNGSAAVRSEVAEWLAIAQAELGFPAEMVRASFDNAIRLDPSNERAKRNLAQFEAFMESAAAKTWDTRSASAVRTWSLAERRVDPSALAEWRFAVAA